MTGLIAIYLLLAAVASALMAGGLVMMKAHSERLPVASGRNILPAIWAWVRDPMWIGGLSVQGLGFLVYVTALAHMPISVMAVMMQAGIAIFVLFAVMFLKERAATREWMGIGAILLGIILLSLTLGGNAPGSVLDSSALVILSAVILILGILPMIAHGMRSNGSAAAILSGVAFGLAGLYTKGMTTEYLAHPEAAAWLRIVADPYVYLAIVTDVAGIVLLQNAFHSARGIIAMPLSSALSNLVPIIGGLIAFGETLPSAPAAASMRVAAFALTIAAGVLLASTRREGSITAAAR